MLHQPCHTCHYSKRDGAAIYLFIYLIGQREGKILLRFLGFATWTWACDLQKSPSPNSAVCVPGTATEALCPQEYCTTEQEFLSAEFLQLTHRGLPKVLKIPLEWLWEAKAEQLSAAVAASSALREFPGISWNRGLDLLTCAMISPRPVAAFYFSFYFGAGGCCCVSP